jgi:hypothetical protein
MNTCFQNKLESLLIYYNNQLILIMFYDNGLMYNLFLWIDPIISMIPSLKIIIYKTSNNRLILPNY